MQNIIEIKKEKGNIADLILRKLPEWFGIESAILDYVNDVENMDMFVYQDEDKPVAFISINKHNKYTAEIHVMGVLREYHRKGIGKKLVKKAEEKLKEEKFEFYTVKTLSPSRESEEYKKTRLFYEALGFRPLEEFKTLWGEDNPCIFLAKYIG